MNTNTFDILCIEPKRIYALTLEKDLRHEQVVMSSFSHSPKLDHAVELINTKNPHVVFLSLSFPTKDVLDFLSAYPPHTRTFGVILVEATREHIHTVRPTLQQYVHRANFATEHQAQYLFIGGFGNRTLVQVVQSAREWLQQRITTMQKEELASSLTEYLSHPYIIAHQRLLQEASEHLESAILSLNKMLRFTSNKDEETLIPCDRIIRIEGDNKYCRVWYYGEAGDLRNEYLIKKTVLEQLTGDVFVQVHRSHMVNITYIRSFTAESVILLTGDEIPCARRERVRVEGMISASSPQLFSALLLQNSLTLSGDSDSLSVRKQQLRHQVPVLPPAEHRFAESLYTVSAP